MSLLKVMKQRGVAVGDTLHTAVGDWATELIIDSGHTDPEELDLAGSKVEEKLTALLMEVALRSPFLMYKISNWKREAENWNRVHGKSQAEIKRVPSPNRLPWIALDVFNVWKGCTFVQPEANGYRFWVVIDIIEDDVNAETITFSARRADIDDLAVRTFIHDYNNKISVIGNIRNYKSTDDNNWGNLT